MKKIILAIGFFFVFHSFVATADISRSDLGLSIQERTNLTKEQVEIFLDKLSQEFNVDSGESIPISGFLFTRGMNAALFLDTDEWLMSATVFDPNTSQLIDIPDLYSVHFYNGGLKLELAYKWMFTFIPSNTSVHQLDGRVYGRGLGGTMECFVGLEGSWMPDSYSIRQQPVYHVALKVGFGAGIHFPKMEFTKRDIR